MRLVAVLGCARRSPSTTRNSAHGPPRASPARRPSPTRAAPRRQRPRTPIRSPPRPTTRSARDVRFSSESDGWLFGDGLWPTHDGGLSWAGVKIPGTVARLEAARGTAWALVTDCSDGETTRLWSSPGTRARHELRRGSRLGDPEPVGDLRHRDGVRGGVVNRRCHLAAGRGELGRGRAADVGYAIIWKRLWQTTAGGESWASSILR